MGRGCCRVNVQKPIKASTPVPRIMAFRRLSGRRSTLLPSVLVTSQATSGEVHYGDGRNDRADDSEKDC